MTAHYILSPLAQSGLYNIWDYTQSHWGADQAETYIRQLWQQIKTIAAQPRRGRACPEVRAEYYKYQSGSHFLFYRITSDGIDVVRILHERMDFERHLP
jgi:toxin ParE1/3/4